MVRKSIANTSLIPSSYIVLFQRSLQPTITGLCPLNQTFLGSGVYRIKLHNIQAFSAFCDMDTDGGEWLVFQRREDGKEDFYRNYTDYTRGFGDLYAEHWLGLEVLHRLTREYSFILRVDLEDWSGGRADATYSDFSISDVADGYRLTVSGYRGNAWDCLGQHSGAKFTTFDENHNSSSSNFAVKYRGAWWYKSVQLCANLNGVYDSGRTHGFVWEKWRGYHYSLKFSEMKIRLNRAREV